MEMQIPWTEKLAGIHPAGSECVLSASAEERVEGALERTECFSGQPPQDQERRVFPAGASWR